MSAHTFSSTNNDEAYTNSGRAGTYNCLGWHLAWKPWFFCHSSDSKLGQMSGVVWKWFLDLKKWPTCVSANPTDPVILCRPCNFYGFQKRNKKIFIPTDPNIFLKIGPWQNGQDSSFAAHSLSMDPPWYTKGQSREEKSTWPNQDSNPRLAYCASTLTTELLSHMVDLWQKHGYWAQWSALLASIVKA